MGDYLFFLSYARRDAKGDPWLRQFYNRLAREVARLSGLPANVEDSEIGFFDDKGIKDGDEWPWSLVSALQTTKVFVCLYSNAYFKSEFGGKEFQIFRSRLDLYRDRHGGIAPSLILPVLWDPIRSVEQLPEAVVDIQYTRPEYGESYTQFGLAHLLRKKNAPAYQDFIARFAQHIVKKAETIKNDLPQLSPFPSIKTVKSAFHATSEPIPPTVDVDHQQLPASAVRPTIKGPNVAWYVYFAGRQADYEGVRMRRECYGQVDGREWQPHLPPVDKKVGIITPNVAHEKNILTDVLPLSQDLIENLRKAEATNTIAVLIVDPWSVKFESYRELMSDYDENRFFNCGVIVVWNTNDDETMENRSELKEQIEATFHRNLEACDIFFRDSVETEDELRNELSAVIEKVRERLMKRGKPVRPIPSTGAELFPTISGQ